MVSIDPGLNTGIAVWSRNGRLKFTDLCKCPKITDDCVRVGVLCSWVYARLLALPDGPVYIEGVRSFASARSWAASTRGNLSLLAYIVGGYIRVCQELGRAVYVIDPQWKGQLTEKALELRIRRAGIAQPLGDHVREAVGLGLSVLQRL